MLTAVLWFGPVTAMFSYLNTVAIFYRVRVGVGRGWGGLGGCLGNAANRWGGEEACQGDHGHT